MADMITHHRGEILQDLEKPRLIEIIHDLVWELEGRRQANLRMINRLKRLAYVDPDQENLTALVNEIMNDREPTWQRA